MTGLLNNYVKPEQMIHVRILQTVMSFKSSITPPATGQQTVTGVESLGGSARSANYLCHRFVIPSYFISYLYLTCKVDGEGEM